MVNGIGSSGAGRAALEAALERMRSKAASMGAPPTDAASRAADDKESFASTLKASVNHVDSTIQRTDGLHLEVLQGKLDIHEVASQLKESEITFQFALQVRNKLIDAYREVMRMSV
jgi:flagellar hook-basal body complex protein FliE